MNLLKSQQEKALKLNLKLLGEVIEAMDGVNPSLMISTLVNVLLQTCAATPDPGKALEAARITLGHEECDEILFNLCQTMRQKQENKK